MSHKPVEADVKRKFDMKPVNSKMIERHSVELIGYQT